MRVLVILNGISRKRKLFYRKIYPQLEEQLQPEVRVTRYAGHAEELAAEAVTQGFEVILSAGGDGTAHQVLNGVMKSGLPVPLLGLIPLGSGNDLARATGAIADARRIIELVRSKQAVQIDVGLISLQDAEGKPLTRYFINECSLGMGPEVVRRVNEGGRSVGVGFMYLKSIVATFLFLKPEAIHVRAGELTWSGKSRVMAIANGKAFGHGIYIAPDSSLSDGLLNMFIAANPPLLRFLMLLQVLKKPRESRDGCLTYATASRVEVTSERPLPVEADGEPVGFTPLYCEVVRNRVNFLCGS